jgi:hypothetical protein
MIKHPFPDVETRVNLNETQQIPAGSRVLGANGAPRYEPR